MPAALPSPLGSQRWHPGKPGARGVCSPWGRGWDEAARQGRWDGQHALRLEMAAGGVLGRAWALALVIRALHCTAGVKPGVEVGLKTELFAGVFTEQQVCWYPSPVSLQGGF